MKSFIITGSIEKREKFILDFIHKEKIASYYVNYFNEEITIDTARKLRNILSKKYNHKYLIVITSSINQIAQNALLKSIEELSDNLSIIISLQDLNGILETIKSRFFLVKLDSYIQEYEDSLDVSLDDDFSKAFISIDKFLLDNSTLSPSEQIDKYIVSYRKKLILELSKMKYMEVKKHINILKKLLEISRLVKFNNLNVRLGIESSII